METELLVGREMLAWLPALISAGASLASGLLGQKSAKKAQKQTFAREDSAVQRRVEDAKKAGVHPLYALGAPLQTAAAQNVGEPMASAVANMGQDISRAAERYTPAAMRAKEFEKRYHTLTLQNMELQNMALASKVMTQNQAGDPPAMEVMAPAEITPFARAGGDKVIFGDPNVSNAQTAEDMWGDVMQNIWGIFKMGADLSYSEKIALAQKEAARFGLEKIFTRNMLRRQYESMRRR